MKPESRCVSPPFLCFSHNLKLKRCAGATVTSLGSIAQPPPPFPLAPHSPLPHQTRSCLLPFPVLPQPLLFPSLILLSVVPPSPLFIFRTLFTPPTLDFLAPFPPSLQGFIERTGMALLCLAALPISSSRVSAIIGGGDGGDMENPASLLHVPCLPTLNNPALPVPPTHSSRSYTPSESWLQNFYILMDEERGEGCLPVSPS
ncbi:unnamed protein product [Closterium sp. Naga37s-1]|nr:unnamed protein product [Closterium sp. Naga37s-1]